MVIENQIPKTETVYKIKDEYKVPSFEEFMKTYESNENLNYDDLSGGGLGEARGYGPCSGCSNSSLKFELEMIIKNSRGGWRSRTVYNVDDARSNVSEIAKRRNYWSDNDSSEFSNRERDSLVDKINEAVEEHINSYRNINRTVSNSVVGDDDGGCSVIM